MKKNKSSIKNLKDLVNIGDFDEVSDYWWMEIGDVTRIPYKNPFLESRWDNSDNIVDALVDFCRDDQYIHFFVKYILNIDLLPYQAVMIRTLWTKALPIVLATRGGAKSFILSVYIVCRAVLHQGCKIAIVGAALRQSMILFNYCLNIFDNSPVLQDICGGKNNGPKRDLHMCHWKVGSSVVIFLPLGNGEKIRGQRANIIIADEFASISQEVFETVVRGFGSVKSDNTFNTVVDAYKRKFMTDQGYDDYLTQEQLDSKHMKIPTMLNSNQLVISGTAYYQFNHIYRYYQYYKAIILSGGNREVLKRDFPDMPLSENIDPNNFAILRIPHDAIPDGMMDQTFLSQGRATMDPSIFDMEYNCIFPADSEGFYLATSLAMCSCPVFDNNRGGKIDFSPKLKGEEHASYIMGIDPASEDDNFSISIIERNKDYRGLVYQWSTNRKRFEELRREKVLKEEIQDYNTFCIKHIRDLLQRFNVELIVSDAGGGGVALRELFKDADKLLHSRDELILDIDDVENRHLEGKRILKLIEFQNYEWRVNSHYGLRKDILDRILLFPSYDVATVAISEYENRFLGKVFDTLDDCYVEIEQAKQETTLIQHSETPSGRETWNVPKVTGIDADQVKKRLKRDRFTSLLLANWGCRLLESDEETSTRSDKKYGGVAKDLYQKSTQSLGSVAAGVQQGPGGRKIFY